MLNNEKVYIEGYVVGFMADAMGTREKQIQVSSGEIVSIDENFIHKSITPEKVKIPQMVADWIEKIKKELSLREAMSQGYAPHEVDSWLREMDQDGACLNQELFARVWLDGYEVKQEKRYLVKMKNMSKKMDCLAFKFGHIWVFRSSEENEEYRTRHTRKELEEAGFGWVFSCEGVEVKEVE